MDNITSITIVWSLVIVCASSYIFFQQYARLKAKKTADTTDGKKIFEYIASHTNVTLQQIAVETELSLSVVCKLVPVICNHPNLVGRLWFDEQTQMVKPGARPRNKKAREIYYQKEKELEIERLKQEQINLQAKEIELKHLEIENQLKKAKGEDIIVCAYCQTKNDANNKFCENCGAPLK